MISNLPNGNLVTALVFLAVTTAVAIAGRMVSHLWAFGWDIWDTRRIRREILTDIAIYGRTYHINVKVVTSESALNILRDQIRADPRGFRGYGTAINDSDVYDEYKKIRRSLSPEDMSRCDMFFGNARLFELYYRKLTTKDFGELSEDRKLLVVGELERLGKNLLESYDKMRSEVNPISKIARRINLETLLPEP